MFINTAVDRALPMWNKSTILLDSTGWSLPYGLRQRFWPFWPRRLGPLIEVQKITDRINTRVHSLVGWVTFSLRIAGYKVGSSDLQCGLPHESVPGIKFSHVPISDLEGNIRSSNVFPLLLWKQQADTCRGTSGSSGFAHVTGTLLCTPLSVNDQKLERKTG